MVQKTPITIATKKIKYLGINSAKMGKIYMKKTLKMLLEDKLMERHPLFLDKMAHHKDISSLSVHL